jgi:hypothetical protein
MLHRLRALLARLTGRTPDRDGLRPEAISALAREVGDLARAAGALGGEKDKLHARLRRIQAEMDQLADLADKKRFRKLSKEKRRQLRDSLHRSREQLLEKVGSAEAPTSRLQ